MKAPEARKFDIFATPAGDCTPWTPAERLEQALGSVLRTESSDPRPKPHLHPCEYMVIDDCWCKIAETRTDTGISHGCIITQIPGLLYSDCLRQESNFFCFNAPGHCLVRACMLHCMRVRLCNGYTQAYVQIMQHTHMHKAVTRHVEAKKLLSLIEGNQTIGMSTIYDQLVSWNFRKKYGKYWKESSHARNLE